MWPYSTLVSDTPGFDLAVTYANRPAVLYVDKLAGKYEATDIACTPAGASSVRSYDVNNDGWTDLVITGTEGGVLLENRNGKLERGTSLAGSGAALFADFANSGRSDVLLGSALFRNHGGNRFEDTRPSPLRNAQAAATADFNGDERIDVAVVRHDGSLDLLENATETANRGIIVNLAGVKNLKSAAGTKVEVKAGRRYAKQTYSGVPLHFGVSRETALETLRITWANGMVQNELKLATGKVLAVKEAPRLSGSCPMIFTWNGGKFEFITDVLGVAPLGAAAGEGLYFPVDHDEYVRIPKGALAARDGEYEVRITEELHEVSYLDHVRLIAVDHAATDEIFTNEKFKSPPFPEFRLFGVKRREYPVSARDRGGHDVLRKVLRQDGAYADGFARSESGAAEQHELVLDFGNAAAANRAVLFLTGWVDWADGSTFLGAAQEKPGGLIAPYLQVKDSSGRWRTAIEDMGVPAGKPKTIAVDLTGKFLSASHEIRIVTTLCVYWDEIFLSEDTDVQVRLTALDAASANLHFRGFSKPLIDRVRRQPERFEYEDLQAISQWNPTPGLYTRYGDARQLVEAVDDRMAIMGSGDELTLKFSAASLPALRAGWTRDFLLLVDGWAKDADPNTAFSQSVEPLPFHTMSAYPYTRREHFPDDAAHKMYRTEYNTRPALRLLRRLGKNQ